jgi:acetoin utilization deacetylase AcuC-like enzyme
MRREVRFWYDEGYVADVLAEGFRHTFDVLRPRRICQGLLDTGLLERGDFVGPEPASIAQLLLVHTEEYVEAISDPDTLARYLLLDPGHPWNENLLRALRLATGGTIEALQAAVEENVLGVNLGGGFHHAQADKAEGFCAIADVAIAIRQLQSQRLVERTLIVDLDYHHGNGNALVFAADESVFTFSLHGGAWCFIDKHNNLDVDLPANADDDTYMALLEENLSGVLELFEPELVVYIAGSDPVVDDTLGQACVTEQGMLRRDRYVTERVLERDIAMAVVTAGGYGAWSWKLYVNYFRWLLEDVAGVGA